MHPIPHSISLHAFHTLILPSPSSFFLIFNSGFTLQEAALAKEQARIQAQRERNAKRHDLFINNPRERIMGIPKQALDEQVECHLVPFPNSTLFVTLIPIPHTSSIPIPVTLLTNE